jgi:hypothetical protein
MSPPGDRKIPSDAPSAGRTALATDAAERENESGDRYAQDDDREDG